MALNWSPYAGSRSDEQPVLLRPLAPPRAPTVFQAAPSFERIDPPTRSALARRRAAPALRPPPPPLADPEAPALMPPPSPVAMPPPPRFAPPADDDDDDRSVASASSAAFGIESSATSFSAREDLPAAAPPFEPPDDDDDEEERSIVEDDISTIGYDSGDDSGDETATYVGEGGARKASSRFWGVGWDRRVKKWAAYYRDADGKNRYIGRFDDEEEAARAYNKAIRDAGLVLKRRINEIDVTGALVPKSGYWQERDRSAVVAPDPARERSATSSKFWGVTWHKQWRRWMAQYLDANGKLRHIGYFDTQEDAAHAVNAAIRRAGLEGRRRTNPVVGGQLVPRVRNSPGQGRRRDKRRRDEPAATPSPRARRPRRAVTYDDSEPDADEE